MIQTTRALTGTSPELEKLFLGSIQTKSQDQISPRIARALLELQAAESLLAKSRATSVAQPSLWLANKLLTVPSVTSTNSLFNARPSGPLHQNFNGARMPRQDAMLGSVIGAAIKIASTSKVEDEKSPRTNATGEARQSNDDRVLRDSDILCGRGGKSNHHAGNKRFRKVVSHMKASYKNIGTKSAKTELSKAIVDHVNQYGGRFVREDKDAGGYVALSCTEARKKTSQALREAKDVKWTA